MLVREDRALARTVAERTGVTHESPQVICIVDGKAIGQASHYGVTAAALKEMLQPPRRA